MILGFSGYGYKQSADPTPTSITSINKLTEANAINDYLYVTNDTSLALTSSIVKEWDLNTILTANYNGDLSAGNVGWAISQILSIRIKYREIGTTQWISLVDVPVLSVNDLKFIRFLKYAKSNTYYDVALVPIMPGNIEGNYNISQVYSVFDSLCVMDKDENYHMINEEITPTNPNDSSILKPLDGQYPIIVYQNSLNYHSIAIKGMFIQMLNNEYDKTGAWKYRANAENWLKNHGIKFVKDSTGRCWIGAITSDITEDSSNFRAEGYTMTSFTLTETGNASNYIDLLNANLIDAN